MASVRARIADVFALTPRMRRIVVAGPDLVGFTHTLAQDVSLALTDAVGNPVRRRYTIRTADPLAGTLTLDAVLHGHGHGPGARWAAHARVGDELEFIGPRGALDLPDVAARLYVSDEAGLPAVAAALEHDTAATIVVVAEVVDSDEHALLNRDGVHWLHRPEADAGSPDALMATLPTVLERLGQLADAHAVVLGESRAITQMRDLLVSRGFVRQRIYAKGYWNLDQRPARPPSGSN